MKIGRTTLAAAVGLAFSGLPFLTGCDRTESRSKETTVKTKETPSGTVKTTETQEKKVETNPK